MLLLFVELIIALLQLPCGHDVTTNVYNAVAAIKEAKLKNPKIQLVILPESFNAPYGTEYFAKYAEKVPEGTTCQTLAKLAQTLGIYIIGGSIIERVEPDKFFNSCTVWSPQGKLIGKHRKVSTSSTCISIVFQLNMQAHRVEILRGKL